MKNQTLATRTQGDRVIITLEVSLEDFDWTGVECTLTVATSRTASPITTFASSGGSDGTELNLVPAGLGRATIVAEAEPSVTARWPTTTLILIATFQGYSPPWGPHTLPVTYLPVVPPNPSL